MMKYLKTSNHNIQETFWDEFSKSYILFSLTPTSSIYVSWISFWREGKQLVTWWLNFWVECVMHHFFKSIINFYPRTNCDINGFKKGITRSRFYQEWKKIHIFLRSCLLQEVLLVLSLILPRLNFWAQIPEFLFSSLSFWKYLWTFKA